MKKTALLLVIQLLFTVATHAQIEWKDYPLPLDEKFKDRTHFGYLTVPETRDSKSQKTLRIAFCLLKSTAKVPDRDAVIYLPGGPGQGYTAAAPRFFGIEALNRILESKDIVLFDVRGCGYSEPQLCDILETPDVVNVNLSNLSDQESDEAYKNACEKCKSSMITGGFNAESYGSYDIAMDIEDLRVALGYEKWNIRGQSYGTRYAQSVMRQYPQNVRSAVLGGLVPSARMADDEAFYGLAHALRLVIDQCGADAECHKAYPDIEKDLLKILARIKEKPIVIDNTGLLSKSPVVIDPAAVLGGIFQALYTKEGIEMIPLLIHTAALGNDWVAEPMVLALVNDLSNRDMFQIIRCNDNPGIAPATRSYFKDDLVDSLYYYWKGGHKITELAFCETLGISLDSTEQLPVKSEIPVLLFTGEFDPTTPTYNTDSVAKYMTNSTSVIVRGRGHDGPVAIQNMIADFFLDPKTNPSLSSRNEEPIKFLTHISLNKGVSAISASIAKGNYLTMAAAGGITLLMILSGLLFFPVRWITFRVKKKMDNLPLRQGLIIWIVSLTSFLFVLLVYFAFSEAVETNPNLLAFGLQEKWSLVFYFPSILILMLIGSALVGRQVWASQASKIVKVLCAVSWLGGFGLVTFLWQWGVI